MSDRPSPLISTSGRQAAGLFFIMAKQAAKRASTDSRGTIGEEQEVMTAVTLCVVVAEAAINEMAEWLEEHGAKPPFNRTQELPYGFDRLELRTKWSLFPMIVRQRSFDRSAEPWQSFEALVELRNFIVHLRRRPLPRSVEGHLRAKLGVTSLTHEVAAWACATIADMLERMTRLVEPPADWLDLVWLYTPTHFPRGLATPGDADYRQQLSEARAATRALKGA